MLKKVIIILIITISLITLTVFSLEIYLERKSNLNKIETLNKSLIEYQEDLKIAKEIDSLNEDYNSLIKEIVQSLANADKQYGIGGLDTESPAYTNKETLEMILEEIKTRGNENWFQNMGNFFNDRENFFNDVPEIWPITRENFGRITSGFGIRTSSVTGNYHHHNGIDIAADRGAPVIATADGIVSGVWRLHPTFGKIVYIEHNNKFETRYAHLDKIIVKYEEKVKKGDIIGYVGDTGVSQGVHLHYEIRKNEQPMDPIKFWLLYY